MAAMLTPDELLALRELSRSVFGQEWRLPVMLVISRRPDPVTLTDLVEDLGLRYPSVLQKPLESLVAAGLIRKLAPLAGSRFRYYERSASSVAWAFADELRARALGQYDDAMASVAPEAAITRLTDRRGNRPGMGA